ncbi:MAG TPA: sugar phosphate isomerase/epimerase [Clostridiaceae bacterium]|nr:sugar phosphate isomerase/epimerase [Clostridiaceae bacterium]
MNKLAVISGFLGAVKNRYITYQEERLLEEKISMAAKIENISGLELCYPQDFDNFEKTSDLLSKYCLGVSAVNFRSRRSGRWMRGSFTSQLKNERAEVTEDLKKAMDYAEKLGCNRITTCPLNEGHDYLFEMDYGKAYDFMEETLGEAASYKPDVKICIEYKLNDPRARCLIGNAGEALAFCMRLGMPNVGVTLDIGHSIQAGERPSQAAVMLARENKLFYVHLNDNDKLWDWDMIPGAYNFWEFIEFFYYLRKIGYDDWFAYDIFPKENDTVKTFSAATSCTIKLMRISERLDEPAVEALFRQRNPSESMKYIFSIL